MKKLLCTTTAALALALGAVGCVEEVETAPGERARAAETSQPAAIEEDDADFRADIDVTERREDVVREPVIVGDDDPDFAADVDVDASRVDVRSESGQQAQPEAEQPAAEETIDERQERAAEEPAAPAEEPAAPQGEQATEAPAEE